MKNIPAFPDFLKDGMTLRDYFAAKAMQAYCSSEEYRKSCGQEDTAISAYQMADAMLAARKN